MESIWWTFFSCHENDKISADVAKNPSILSVRSDVGYNLSSHDWLVLSCSHNTQHTHTHTYIHSTHTHAHTLSTSELLEKAETPLHRGVQRVQPEARWVEGEGDRIHKLGVHQQGLGLRGVRRPRRQLLLDLTYKADRHLLLKLVNRCVQVEDLYDLWKRDNSLTGVYRLRIFMICEREITR